MSEQDDGLLLADYEKWSKENQEKVQREIEHVVIGLMHGAHRAVTDLQYYPTDATGSMLRVVAVRVAAALLPFPSKDRESAIREGLDSIIKEASQRLEIKRAQAEMLMKPDVNVH